MNTEEFIELEQKFGDIKVKRQVLEKGLKRIEKQLEELMYDRVAAMKARTILQLVAEKTQKKLEYHISKLVTMALSVVFPDPYEFKAEFVQKRNKVECELWLVKDGEKTKPMDAVGGGVLDVLSFACRVALWSLKKNRPVMILDEPFKFLHSEDLQRNCSVMVKELSDRLGIQFIIVTDQSDIEGDRTFLVKNGEVTLMR